MFGPIGPIISERLKRRGYTITRATDIEREFTKSVWDVCFSKDIEEFAHVYAVNRSTLAAVPLWLDQETIRASLWRYGVPEEWVAPESVLESTGVDQIENDITASDVLAFVARKLGQGVCYLEIGVSVGKNLLQLERQISHAHIVGLDVEELNPILKSKFETCKKTLEGPHFYAVDTLSGKQAQKQTTMLRLTSSHNNTFDYLSADQFRRDTWETLRGRKFNLIFSDGVHNAKALRSEMDFLLEMELIDTARCVMFWDDLHGQEMQQAFLDNSRKLVALLNRDDSAISIFRLHGTYGYQRPMGMFSSIF